MSAIDKVNDPLGPRQASGVNKPGNAAKHSQRSPLVAKDVLELSSHRLEEAERQVEAEFAARKARVIAQEKLISMTRTRPWTKSPSCWPRATSSTVDRPSLLNTLRKDEPIYPSPTRCSRALR